jgi:hypothetical protein
MRCALNLLLAAGFAFAAPPADLLKTAPLRFEPAGNPGYRWIARGAAYEVAFSDRATLLGAGERVLRLTLEGSNPRAAFEGAEKLPFLTNYFRGHDYRGAPTYARLKRPGVYPGIDIVYYGDGQNLEYDFELAPGADPSVVAMRFEGADTFRLNTRGDIVVGLGGGEITQRVPVVYQRTSSDEIVSVPASYRIAEDGAVRLALGEYNARRPLVIDPSVVLTAYMTGTGADATIGMAHDAQGFLYMVGYTFSTDFPLVGDPYNIFIRNNNRMVWIMKLDPRSAGNGLVLYSTFFGGASNNDPKAMTVDANGVVYFTGLTDAFDFPTTSTGYVTSFGGGTNRIFITAFDPARSGSDSILYSTLFGGTKTEEPTGIAVANGKVYITGFTTSDDYPIGAAIQETRGGSYDAIVAVFDPAQSGAASLLFSTYLGSYGQDIARAIAVDSSGRIYVAGLTYSSDFFTTPGSYRPFYSGGGDGFLTRINLDTHRIDYSTLVGGSDADQVRKIVIQPNGRVALAGYTLSSDFPVTQNAVQPLPGGNGDAFLTVIDPAAPDFTRALIYSTYFGGSDGESAYDLRTDASGKYFLCGYTLSQDFPVRNALNPTSADGGVDGFVAVIDTAAQPFNSLLYSSYLTGAGTQTAMGVDVASTGEVMVAGNSTGGIFGPGEAAPVIPSSTNVFLLVFHY